MKLFLLTLLIIHGMLIPFAHADFQAGIATRVVTPDSLLPVSGGAGPSKAAQTVKGDLTVRALVLANTDTSIAICSIDFLGLTSAFADQVKEQVSNIPPENILIGATHTHSAPDLYGFPDENGEINFNREYFNWVCQQTADAINTAYSKLQPARLKVNTDEARGQIAYNYYAPQLYDPRCHVMQVVDPSGDAIATLVNYAIHPEVLGADQGILSPDLIGPLYDRIQQNGGGVGIFMNGALGGMVTADNRTSDGKDEYRTWEECVRIGHLLADEALRIIKDTPVQNDPTLFCAQRKIAFLIETPLMQHLIKISPIDYELNEDGTLPATLHVVNIGNAQILTIPGEALPNIGYYLKRKMHGEHNLLFGLTNEALGYILTKEDFNSFKRYDYISRTSLGEQTGEILVDEALDFINNSQKPEWLEN